MGSIFDKAEQVQQQAWSVIEETGVIGHWTSIGATVNLVGSLRTGLLINNRDIDFHIYTNPFRLSDSFLAISKLAECNRITAVNYANLLEEEDKCIEWHASYDDEGGNVWKMDMIHILNESPYAGYFEDVADRIASVLTRETREAILRIKDTISTEAEEEVKSIEVYRAVIEDGIRDIEAFRRWRKQHARGGIIRWMP